MRLFIAIPLPADIKDFLTQMKDKSLPIKWSKPENYHLTLRFIGEVNKERCNSICEQLKSVRRDELFELKLSGLGAFPNTDKPRVIWSGVDPEKPVEDLYINIEKALRCIDEKSDEKTYHPHVTIGRVKKPVPEIQGYLRDNQSSSSRRFRVDRFCLYESELRKEGAVHTVIETYLLGNEL